MCNNLDGITSTFLSECVQMKLDLKEYICIIYIKFETSKEKLVEIEVMTCVTLEGNDQLEVGFRRTVLFHILVSVTVVILLNKIH